MKQSAGRRKSDEDTGKRGNRGIALTEANYGTLLPVIMIYYVVYYNRKNLNDEKRLEWLNQIDAGDL
jgi:hypothetical protein